VGWGGLTLTGQFNIDNLNREYGKVNKAIALKKKVP
jgi:hypothetical protein